MPEMRYDPEICGYRYKKFPPCVYCGRKYPEVEIVEYNELWGGYVCHECFKLIWQNNKFVERKLLIEYGFGDPDVKKSDNLLGEKRCTRCGREKPIAFGYAGHALCDSCFKLYLFIAKKAKAIRGQVACSCGAIGSHICPILPDMGG